MKHTETFCGAVLAGLAIGVGCTVYLSLDNRIAGAILFAVGLYMICVHGLYLFTGKVGYLADKGAGYLPELGVIWLGNLAGTWLAGTALRMTRIQGVGEKAAAMCAVKNGDSLLSLLILGVFCGILMFAAVDGYKKCGHPLLLAGCVAAFILCGFEHCIADMFYYAAAGAWSLRSLLCVAVITLGNALGGMLIPLFRKLPSERA